MVTIALSDREFKKFYENDVKFKNYFDKQSYPSEIAQFLKFILNKIPDSRFDILYLFNQLRDKITFFDIDSKEIKDLFSSENYAIFYTTSIKEKLHLKV